MWKNCGEKRNRETGVVVGYSPGMWARSRSFWWLSAARILRPGDSGARASRQVWILWKCGEERERGNDGGVQEGTSLIL